MRPLLCELHAHTTWSDGTLSLRELVHLYGAHGFDVLCVTDHASPPGARSPSTAWAPSQLAAYLAAIEREAARALVRYGLLLLPGSSSPSTTRTPTGRRTRSRSGSGVPSRSRTALRRR